jgi:hypothetical protein
MLAVGGLILVYGLDAYVSVIETRRTYGPILPSRGAAWLIAGGVSVVWLGLYLL